MFRPPSIFHAGRKMSELRRHLDTAGHPISREAAQSILAKAWGWTSWSELAGVLEEPGEPSKFDEDLVGPVARRGVMYRHHLRIVARRGTTAVITIMRELGLPVEMAMSLCAIVQFTGRHEPDPEARARARSVRRPRNLNDAADGPESLEVWRTPGQFREDYRLGWEGPSPEWQGFLNDLDAHHDKPPTLPPHRPR